MMSKNDILTNKIARLCYLLGSAFLLVVVTISFVQPPEEAVGAPSVDHCKPGYVYKQDAPPPWEYNGTEIITEVQIKSAQGCFKLTTSNPTDGCYQAIGLGTTNVRVFRSGDESPECQAISHVYYYADREEPTATPTDTATPTETATPIATDPIVTFTPTETELPPTDTPTATATIPLPENPTPTGTQDKPAPTKVKRTPPATLPPPTPLPGSSTPMVLIPVTGARTAGQNQGSGINGWLVIPLGIGVFGLGIAFYGIATRLKQG
jgi:hypothetical protein